MTEAKPCLPGCVTTQGRGGDIKSHAPACPNAPPEAPREAIWDNTTVCYGSDCPHCAREKAEGKPAPAPEPKRHKYVSSPDRGGCVVSVDGLYCGMHRLAPVHRAPEPKQGSEEPIDWEKAELWAAGTAQGDARLSQVQAARAFIALRAEVERLKKLHSDHCSNPICEGPRS